MGQFEPKISKWWANFQKRDERWKINTCFRINLYWSSMRRWSVFNDLSWSRKIVDENFPKNISILANSDFLTLIRMIRAQKNSIRAY